MKKEPYIPQPFDTKDIELPEELKPLVEQMAKNVHETWAETRIAQGWTYGPERNDAEKKHPCLVPYEQLPEEEKVYDRNTSVQTLKFILGNGFCIKPLRVGCSKNGLFFCHSWVGQIFGAECFLTSFGLKIFINCFHFVLAIGTFAAH